MISRRSPVTLRILGGLILERDGQPITGRATQRRRLAVLALLAGSPGRMLSRDRVVGLLWPEAATDAARHHLADAVYALRRALGNDAIQSRGDDLLLNPALVELDLSGFEEAVLAGDWERAVTLYRGPFADGFLVAEAPEFDQWLEATRARCRRSYRDALEQWARQHALADRREAASAAWLRLTNDDPADGRVVLETVRALDRAGNRAQAIRQARTHAVLLRQELGTELSAELLAVVRELETGPVPPPATTSADGQGSTPPPPLTRRRPPRSAALMGAAALAGLIVISVASGGVAGPVASGHLAEIARRLAANPAAADAFRQGELLYQEGRHLPAADHFRRAVTLDTTYALAWYRLSQSILGADLPEPRAAAADSAALRHADLLPERERLLLRAWSHFRSGNAETAEERYRNLVSLYPDDLEGWLHLGETLFHYNPQRGRGIAEARVPFERALALDASNRTARWHLALLDASDHASGSFVRQVDRLLDLGVEPARELELRVLRAVALGDRQTEAALNGRLRQTDEIRLFGMYWRAAVHLGDLDAAGRLAAYLGSPDRPLYSRLIGYGGRSTLAAVRGRRREAAALLDSVARASTSLALRRDISDARRQIHELMDRWITLPAGGGVPDPGALLDSLNRDVASGWFGLAVTSSNTDRSMPRWLRAEALFQLGRYEEALGWYGSFTEHGAHDLIFLPGVLYRRGEALERLGRRPEARAEYRRLALLWRDADPEFRPLSDSVARRLARWR